MAGKGGGWRRAGAVGVVCVLGAMLASGARAQSDSGAGGPDYGAAGLYVWLGGATGVDMAAEDAVKQDLASVGLPPGTSLDVRPAVGFNARIGLRSGSHFASEVQFEYLPSFDWDVSQGGSSVTAVEMRVLTFTGNLKIYPMSGRFQPFALIGAGGTFARVSSPLVSGSESASGFAFRAGGGVDAYLSEHVALSVDLSYLLPRGDTEDLDYLSIGWGLLYRF